MKKFRRLFRRTHPNAPRPEPNSTVSRWSLGVLVGKSLGELREPTNIKNPVLTASDVKDRRTCMLADPFLFQHQGLWYLFFELFDDDLVRGVIAYATSSDGLDWNYQGVVLEESFHLSYPYVFSCDGEIYMIPETKKRREVRLYRAKRFPDSWVFEKTLLRGKFADASIIHYENRWWIFAARGAYSLSLFYADNLLGRWKSHRWPFFYYRDKSRARPGGRMSVNNGKIVRFAQDAKLYYGHQVRAFEVDILTPKRFKEHEISPDPVLTPAITGWNNVGMHHIDAQNLPDGSILAIVDGAGYP